MKRYSILVLILWVAAGAQAAPISPTTAEQIAVQWLGRAQVQARRSACGTEEAAQARRSACGTADEAAQPLYVYNFGENDGYVLVAGDDRARDMVLGYSETGHFDYNRLCDAERAWIDGYVEQIQSLPDQEDEQETSVASPRQLPIVVVPAMLNTAWNQNAPYNSLCPLVHDSATMVGCVALAWAMVCKYMEYPASASFDYDYIWARNDSTRRTGSVRSTYDYAQMPTRTYVDTSPERIAAVAQLCADIGSAVQMNYGAKSSSAVPRAALGKMVTHFGLDQGMVNHYRKHYTDADWDAMLKSELDAGRPMIYSGWKSGGGGHTFVCDGYNSNDYFHFNYGHGDVSSTAFYKSSAVKNDYNTNQEVITNIVPRNDSKVPGVDGTINGDLTVSDLSKLSFTVQAKAYFSATAVCKVYNTICLENIATGVCYYGDEKNISCNTPNDWSYTTNTVSYSVSSTKRAKIPQGDYRCYPVYRVTVGSVSGDWQRFYFPTDQYVDEVCIRRGKLSNELIDCPSVVPTELNRVPSAPKGRCVMKNGRVVLRYNEHDYSLLGTEL
ncbi:MAG: C10 family peptidase [Paludibacteraceae bacterium]|nr:C10 family peptidase [Paludibacteraceae bacterium]